METPEGGQLPLGGSITRTEGTPPAAPVAGIAPRTDVQILTTLFVARSNGGPPLGVCDRVGVFGHTVICSSSCHAHSPRPNAPPSASGCSPQGRTSSSGRGIRATTVEQLARASGISKGAFYLFYPSKEALFFAIVEEVETTMQARLEEQVAEAPHDALRLLLRASLQARDENPLFDVAISEEAVAVMRTMPPEEQEAFLRRDIEMTRSIAARLAAAGVTVKVSPEVLAGLLRAMVFVGMHRDDIGAGMAPAVEDFLVDSSGDGALRRRRSPRRAPARAVSGRRRLMTAPRRRPSAPRACPAATVTSSPSTASTSPSSAARSTASSA